MEPLTAEYFTNHPDKEVVIGWSKVEGVARSFANPNGWACVWGVLWKILQGSKNFLYEQPMLFENEGAVVLLKKGEKFGLVQNYRLIGKRLPVPPEWKKGYIAYLNEHKLWGELLETLGQWTWEAPMGLGKNIDTTNGLENMIHEIAKKEAMEEAGCVIKNLKILGEGVDKPTFVAHA